MGRAGDRSRVHEAVVAAADGGGVQQGRVGVHGERRPVRVEHGHIPGDQIRREQLVRGLQKHIEVDEPEDDDEIEMMTAASLANEANMDVAGTTTPASAGNDLDYGSDEVLEE